MTDKTNLEEGVGQALKSLVGKSDKQIAAKRSKEFAQRKVEAAKRERQNASQSQASVNWHNHGGYDTTLKRGARSEEVEQTGEQIDENAVKIPAHDEIAGDLPHAPAQTAQVKLATKSQLKMLVQGVRNKAVSHTEVQVPEVTKEEAIVRVGDAVKKEGSDLVPPAIPTSKGKNPHGNGAQKASAPEPMKGVCKEEVEQIDELSNEKLGAYKKAAGADASAADKAGNFKRGNKRFSGIVKATNKQFANDAKKRQANEEVEHLEEKDQKTVSAPVKKAIYKHQPDLPGIPAKPKGHHPFYRQGDRVAYKEEVMISFKDYLKEDHTEYDVLETSEELAEEFISHSEFEDKLKNHKSHGMVLHHDYDHKAKKAIIRHVDHDGEVREFHYHDKGTTVQRLAPRKAAGKEHEATAPAKRGRGRPPGKYGSYKKKSD